MDVPQGLVIALVIAALVTCGVMIFALVEAVRTLRSARKLFDDLGETVPPLVEKGDVVLDALGAEILRVDTIVDEIEQFTVKVSHTAAVVQDAVNAPANAVNVAGERIRGAWKRAKRFRREKAGTPEGL